MNESALRDELTARNYVYVSGNFTSAALAGRFGMILRVPRVETG